jgi:hypothetical protein
MPGKSPPPTRPVHEAGDYVAYGLMALLSVLGLFMASHAHDDEIYLFGFSLTGFGIVFLLWELKRHYDVRDAVRVHAKENSHG